MVLTRKAAEQHRARAIYEQGLADGQSFEQIERAINEALPELNTPLVPRNVPWFAIRARDFANPELAQQIMEAYAEDRGEGKRLYRFPVIFPSDHWQTGMPHELAAWGANDKRFWSEYSADGRQRHCMCRAPVPRSAREIARLVSKERPPGPIGCAHSRSPECNAWSPTSCSKVG